MGQQARKPTQVAQEATSANNVRRDHRGCRDHMCPGRPLSLCFAPIEPGAPESTGRPFLSSSPSQLLGVVLSYLQWISLHFKSTAVGS